MEILDMQEVHSKDVQRIFEEGINTGNATFETSAPSWKEWDEAHLREPRLVVMEDDKVLGWAALTPVSGRCVYAGVAEVSIYLSEKARGKGIGKMLLKALIEKSEDLGIWTLQAGIFPENTVSIKIHEACGFSLVGIRKKIGKMKEQWRDVALLERRSPAAKFN